MKVAVISDIHENYHNLIKALDVMRARGVEQILCLGDLMNAGIAEVLADSGIPTFGIWGNNDGDRLAILRVALSAANRLTMGDKSYAAIEVGGRRVFLTHYGDLAGPVARGQDFDAVFYGHDHRKSQERVGACLVVNPGEISGHKTGEATFALYDTEEQRVEFVAVPDAVSLRTQFVVERVPGEIFAPKH